MIEVHFQLVYLKEASTNAPQRSSYPGVHFYAKAELLLLPLKKIHRASPPLNAYLHAKLDQTHDEVYNALLPLSGYEKI